MDDYLNICLFPDLLRMTYTPGKPCGLRGFVAKSRLQDYTTPKRYLGSEWIEASSKRIISFASFQKVNVRTTGALYFSASVFIFTTNVLKLVLIKRLSSAGTPERQGETKQFSRDWQRSLVSMDKYTTKWGDIEARPGKRGIEILAMNHERGRRVHIGTIKRGVYEKGNAAILRKPEPSFCMMRAELEAVKENGAEILRLITPEKQPYTISLSDFEQYAEVYFNAFYGEQMRCSRRHFETTTATRKAQNVTVTLPPSWQQPTMTGFEPYKNFPVPCEVE